MRDSDRPMTQREAYQRGYAAGYAAAQSGPPREPTRAMLDAGLAYYEGRTGARMVTIGGIWDAMYDAWAQEQTGGSTDGRAGYSRDAGNPIAPLAAGVESGPPDHQCWQLGTLAACRDSRQCTRPECPPHQPAATPEHGGSVVEPAEVTTSAIGPAADPSPVDYRYLFTDPITRVPIWRHESREWNGQHPVRSEPLYSADALKRLRAERDTLAAIVRAADAMHLKPTMDNINAWLEARAKWEGK